MKTSCTIIALLLSTLTMFGQNETPQHFEVSGSVILWTPTSLHLKSINSVTQYALPDGTYYSMESFSGYGFSFSPELKVSYFFNENLGISLGGNLVHMDNELSVINTDSTFSSYENMADIINITLGLSGRFKNSSAMSLYYEAGINVVALYDLEMNYSTESSDPPDMEATGSAIGLYINTGGDIRLFPSLYLKTGLRYNFIPVEMEYKNGEGSEKISVKSNLGGIGIQTGLSFRF